MDAAEWSDELLSNLTGVCLTSPGGWEQAAADIKSLRAKGLGQLHTNREASSVRTIDDVLMWLTHERKVNDVRVFVIDHLQLISVPGMRNEYEEANAAVRLLMQFARDRRCIIVLISQLNRAHSHLNQQPDVIGLWGSRALEQGSQIIVLIDHTRMEYDEDTHQTRTWLLLQKNRWGASFKEIPIALDYRTHTVREALPDEEHLWPGT